MLSLAFAFFGTASAVKTPTPESYYGAPHSHYGEQYNVYRYQGPYYYNDNNNKHYAHAQGSYISNYTSNGYNHNQVNRNNYGYQRQSSNCVNCEKKTYYTLPSNRGTYKTYNYTTKSCPGGCEIPQTRVVYSKNGGTTGTRFRAPSEYKAPCYPGQNQINNGRYTQNRQVQNHSAPYYRSTVNHCTTCN